MKVLEGIEKRRSIRKFKKKEVKWGLVLEAVDAALQAPLAGNINALKFIVITSQELKNALAQHADQDWIAESDTIVAICSDNAQLERMYYDRADRYARQQAGAAIQNFLLRITELGLGACWVGAYLDSAVKRDLKIPNNVNVEALIAVGHPAEKPKHPKKAALESTIMWEQWGQKKRPVQSQDPKTW